MEQHPVPQQISSYQFRLVGDMTLKQFFQLAGGALIALMFYASPLPNIFKWPLIVFFALSGAAFAFLPFEERPLEVWVFAFFRSIYSPTLFYWKKYETQPQYFVADTASPAVSSLPEVPATTVEIGNVSSADAAILSKFEKEESNFMTKIGNIFKGTHAEAVTPASTIPQASSPTIPVSVVNKQAPKPQQEVYQAPTTPVVMPPSQVQSISQTLQNQPTNSSAAQFSVDAAPPHPAEKPNIIVGQVMDRNKKIVEGAIIEVRDEQGRSVRALKTNKAGHFLIVTPLSNGKYQLVTEKPELEFDTVSFEATGQIIPAIAITAK